MEGFGAAALGRAETVDPVLTITVKFDLPGALGFGAGLQMAADAALTVSPAAGFWAVAFSRGIAFAGTLARGVSSVEMEGTEERL